MSSGKGKRLIYKIPQLIIIVLWLDAAQYYFRKLFIKCLTINENCYSLIDYELVFPLLTVLAYISYSSLIKTQKKLRVITTAILFLLTITAPIVIFNISNRVQEATNIDNSIMAQIMVAVSVLILVFLYYLLDRRSKYKS